MLMAIGKEKCTYNKLKNNSFIKKSLRKFWGENAPVYPVIKEGDLDSVTSGKTEYGI